MSKKTKRIVSVVVLLGLGITAWWIASTEGYFSGNYSTLKKGLSDFSIKDTAHVDRIAISIYDGKKVVLTKKKSGYWEVNNSFRARKDAVDQLLEMAYQIRVRSTVGDNARANIIKRISSFYKKVEYYVNGELEKTYYVGTG